MSLGDCLSGLSLGPALSIAQSQKKWNKYKITEIVHMHKRATRQNLPVFPYKVAVFFISNSPKVVLLLFPASSIGFKVKV